MGQVRLDDGAFDVEIESEVGCEVRSEDSEGDDAIREEGAETEEAGEVYPMSCTSAVSATRTSSEMVALGSCDMIVKAPRKISGKGR